MQPPPPSGPRPPAAAPEPAPPLRAVVDLPLRYNISDDRLSDIHALGQRVRQSGADADWPALYSQAIQIVETIVRDTDTRIEELQRRSLTSDDPLEIKQRLSQGPRRDAEKVRTEARTALQKATKDWTERTKRQLDHVALQCQQSAQSGLQLQEFPTATGISLKVDPTWWAQYTGYVSRCCEEWTRNATQGAEQALAEAVSASTAAASSLTRGDAVRSPPTLSAPTNEARFNAELPVKDADVPSTGTALMAYVRGNMMSVGIFGTVLAVVIGLMGKFTGHDDHNNDGPNATLVRGGLLLAVLPVSIVFGLIGAKKQRVVLREKALAAQKTSVQAFVKTELDKALEKHRKALERWIAARSDNWVAAVDRWWDEAVEPRLQQADAGATEAMREQKIQQARLQEEQGALRTLKGSLSQQLLFDLRKRQRELADMAAARAGGAT